MEATPKILTPPYVRPSQVKKIKTALEEFYHLKELRKKGKRKPNKNGKTPLHLNKVNGHS